MTTGYLLRKVGPEPILDDDGVLWVVDIRFESFSGPGGVVETTTVSAKNFRGKSVAAKFTGAIVTDPARHEEALSRIFSGLNPESTTENYEPVSGSLEDLFSLLARE